jgi:hypothetical protein
MDRELTIGGAFPAGSLAEQWVVTLGMAMNDSRRLMARSTMRLKQGGPDGQYFFRLLCGTLREIWGLFEVATEHDEFKELVDGMAQEARNAYG